MATGVASTTSQCVRTSNSFNALIPFVFEVEDPASPQECEGVPLEEEVENGEHNSKEVEEEVSTSPMSSKQKKKEAKKLFSGKRPKGRHRS